MDKNELQKRMEQAIRLTAPGQPIRTALDMIIAGHLGALICVGDTENVLAAGNDGFPLNISFTSNRLFELSKMDGAIVIDGDLTQILRANFHLNPDPSLATSETGMRHRTAARMSVLTDAIVISVSARRAVVNVYVHGKSYEIQPVTTIMSSVNQLVATLQTTRQSLDRSLLRLTALELDDYVTLADITGIFSSFEIMQQAKTELKDCIVKLGNQGKLVQMQLEQLAGSSMDTEYDLMIRDYASDSSEANAEKIRAELARMTPKDLSDPQHVAAVLGYDDLDEDSVMTPLGLRTLSRVSVVRDGVAEKIVDEYGSLQELMDDISEDPERLGDFGVNNPAILADSLYRMKGMDTEYDLMIRDYASDSSEANAEKIRAELARMTPKDLSDPQHVAAVLGYDDLDEDSVMTPLGLRTLSRVSVVRDGVAEKIVDEYGSLQELMDDISEDPERLGDFGVNNPAILADSLYRMKGTKQGNA